MSERLRYDPRPIVSVMVDELTTSIARPYEDPVTHEMRQIGTLPLSEGGLVGIQRLAETEKQVRDNKPKVYETSLKTGDWLNKAQKVGMKEGPIVVSRASIDEASERVVNGGGTKKDYTVLELASDLHLVEPNGNSLGERIYEGKVMVVAPPDGALALKNIVIPTASDK